MLGAVRAMALGISRVGMTGFARFEVPAFAGTTKGDERGSRLPARERRKGTSEVPAFAGTTKGDERGSRLRGNDGVFPKLMWDSFAVDGYAACRSFAPQIYWPAPSGTYSVAIPTGASSLANPGTNPRSRPLAPGAGREDHPARPVGGARGVPLDCAEFRGAAAGDSGRLWPVRRGRRRFGVGAGSSRRPGGPARRGGHGPGAALLGPAAGGVPAGLGPSRDSHGRIAGVFAAAGGDCAAGRGPFHLAPGRCRFPVLPLCQPAGHGPVPARRGRQHRRRGRAAGHRRAAALAYLAGDYQRLCRHPPAAGIAGHLGFPQHRADHRTGGGGGRRPAGCGRPARC